MPTRFFGRSSRQTEGFVVFGTERVPDATMPQSCPEHHLAVKAEVIFAESGDPAMPVSAPAEFNAPCPRLAELPPETAVPGTGGVITAPANNVCVSRRDFTIHVIQIKHLVYRQVSVYVNGHRVSVARGARVSAPVNLRGLPKGQYTVKIAVTTSSGRRITGTRTYHTCAAKPLRGHKHLL
jgi:hypothetical protein